MRYANIQNGVVIEVIAPAYYEILGIGPDGEVTSTQGDEIPIELRYHPDLVAVLVPIPEGATVVQGDTWDGAAFGPPAAPPAPTAAEVLAMRDTLLAQATLRIAPLQDAVDLDEATPAEAATLTLWKKYRVALSRIETQAGFPAAVVWPTMP